MVLLNMNTIMFFGNYSSDPILNPEEASDFKWIKINDLKNDIEKPK